MSVDNFLTYYQSEKNNLDLLLLKINKATGGFDKAIAKYKLERPEIIELIENRRKRAVTND